MSQPRFVIADQGLTGYEGHHLEYDLAVLEASNAVGYEIILLANEGFGLSGVDNARVIRSFPRAFDNNRQSIIRHTLLPVLGRLPDPVREHLLSVRSYVPRVRAKPRKDDVGSIVARAVDDLHLTEGDLVLMHTLRHTELGDLVRALGGRTHLPDLHVVLRYEESKRSVAKIGISVAADPVLARRIHFWSDTEALALYYQQCHLANVGVLPIPHCGPEEIPNRPALPMVLTYLGGARFDKGYDRLPHLARVLADDYLSTQRAKLVVQSNYSFSLHEPKMRRATAELRAFPPDWVSCVDGPFSKEDFDRLLTASHLLLLPYQAELYRRRSSGLAVLAAVAGIPAVVPAGTWLSKATPPTTHVEFDGARTFADAVRLAIDQYESLSHAAAAWAPAARATYSSERLVTMLAAASEPAS